MKNSYRLKQNATIHTDANLSSQVIAELKTGDTITVDGSANSESGQWDAITLSDGRTGYISGKTKAEKLGRGSICPSCKRENPVGTTDCLSCGKSLRPTEIIVVALFCFYCGAVGLAAFFHLVEEPRNVLVAAYGLVMTIVAVLLLQGNFGAWCVLQFLFACCFAFGFFTSSLQGDDAIGSLVGWLGVLVFWVLLNTSRAVNFCSRRDKVPRDKAPG